jgi:hypothetical protein
MYGFSGHSWSLLCTDFPDTSDSKCLDFPDASVWIFRTGCLDFPYRVLFFLALKNDPIPAQKITGRRVDHVSYFSQPPVRCLALAVDAKARPGCYYAKAIVLYLSETAPAVSLFTPTSFAAWRIERYIRLLFLKLELYLCLRAT